MGGAGRPAGGTAHGDLDTTIANEALPSIQKGLHFKSGADLQWVINAYVLAAGGFLLLGGRVADRYGRRLVFVSGIRCVMCDLWRDTIESDTPPGAYPRARLSSGSRPSPSRG